MALSKELMATTGRRAPGIVVYGGPDMRKTFGIRTLPPPIFMIDMEGGSGNLLPWTRYVLSFSDDETDTPETTEITKAEREAAWEFTKDAFTMRSKAYEWKAESVPPPGPLIDVISIDPLRSEAYPQVWKQLENFPVELYNSIVVDSLMEFAVSTQTFQKSRVKGSKGETLEPRALTMQETAAWSPAQERASILLRMMRSLRDKGIVVAATSGEFIEKEYVTTPFAQQKGQREEPYSVVGSPTMPGRLTTEIKHLGDIILHARTSGTNVIWERARKTITEGSPAFWETKDRFGRLPDYVAPSYFEVLQYVYGKDATKKLYDEAYKKVGAA